MKSSFSSKLGQYENIDKYLSNLILKTKNQNLIKTIQNTFKFSLLRTLEFNEEKQDTFVITGDIHAMWLRDSTNQVQPYIQFIKDDEQLKKVIKYLVFRQSKCVLIDFYSNAFNKDHEGYSSKQDRSTEIVNGKIIERTVDDRIFERKWEIDSIGFHLKLINQYITQTSDFTVINFESLTKIATELHKMQMGSFEDMQNNKETQQIKQSSYTFSRPTTIPSETLQFSSGDPAIRTGMIRSNFRPSDDSQTFQFSIPGNALLQTELTKLVALLIIFKGTSQGKPNESKVNGLIEIFDKMQKEILAGILQYGLIQDPVNNEMYLAYEVDGYGSQLFMDDANLPSLLSLPYLGFLSNSDELYQNTRKRLLNINQNKFFFQGKEASGIGGVHVGFDMIWPMSIIMQGLTSNNEEEIKQCLITVINTTANTYMIHESFNKDTQYQFTRSEFGWANSLFAEFVMFVDKNYPDILKQI